MDKMIARFPDQLREAIQIGEKLELQQHPNEIHQIYVAGMGGSGIGGDFVAEWVLDRCPVPVFVGKGYRLPRWVGPTTTAIVSSYSGNTEETLSVYEQLKARKVPVIGLTSGGALIQNINKDGFDALQVPGNWASPRACLGYSIVGQLYILHRLGLVDDFFKKQILDAADLLENQMDTIREEARHIASRLKGKFIMIYAIEGMEPVALRFRQQINENAKTRAAYYVIPEMNHNELVGWKHEDPHLVSVHFLSDYDSERNRIRQAITQEIMEEKASDVLQLRAKGSSKIEQSLYLVYLGDWISWYLAMERGVDAIEVDVIDYLKGALAKEN